MFSKPGLVVISTPGQKDLCLCLDRNVDTTQTAMIVISTLHTTALTSKHGLCLHDRYEQ